MEPHREKTGLLSLGKQRRRSASQCQTWSETPKTSFLASRLNDLDHKDVTKIFLILLSMINKIQMDRWLELLTKLMRSESSIHALTKVLPRSGPEVIKLFSCSAQLRLKFILLINVKLILLIKGFFDLNLKFQFIWTISVFMSILNFMLS